MIPDLQRQLDQVERIYKGGLDYIERLNCDDSVKGELTAIIIAEHKANLRQVIDNLLASSRQPWF